MLKELPSGTLGEVLTNDAALVEKWSSESLAFVSWCLAVDMNVRGGAADMMNDAWFTMHLQGAGMDPTVLASAQVRGAGYSGGGWEGWGEPPCSWRLAPNLAPLPTNPPPPPRGARSTPTPLRRWSGRGSTRRRWRAMSSPAAWCRLRWRRRRLRLRKRLLWT